MHFRFYGKVICGRKYQVSSICTWIFFLQNIDKYTATITRFATKNRKAIVNSIWTIILLGYIGYLTYACFLNLNDATAVLSITGVVLFFYIYAFVRDHFGDIIWEKCCIPTSDILSAIWDVGKGWVHYVDRLQAVRDKSYIDVRVVYNVYCKTGSTKWFKEKTVKSTH